ncbi:MAG: DNA polymerase III subunit delta [Eggerthellaceae bacterium]|jgi:DNA polymerase-3 subunit delta
MAAKQEQELLCAYLIVGDDNLKRDAVLRRLYRRLSEVGDISFNASKLDGTTATGDEIIGVCNTIPFASPVRLVEVQNADKIKKADALKLSDYLQSPAKTAVLALVAETMPKTSMIYKAVDALGPTAVISCARVKRKELPHLVQSLAQANGVSFTPGAVAALIDAVGEDTIHLNGEIEKIALAHRGEDPVTEHEIAQTVVRTAEVKPWEFVNAFSARDFNKCVLYRENMPSASPYSLLALCTARIRELICARTLESRGEIQNLSQVLKLPAWRVRNHLQWAHQYSLRELEQALSSSRDLEKSMKGGADPDQAFYNWVFTTVSRNPRP